MKNEIERFPLAFECDAVYCPNFPISAVTHPEKEEDEDWREGESGWGDGG